MTRIYKRKQPIKPYWVRKRIFKCKLHELNNYHSWLNRNFIIFAYDEFNYNKHGVDIPVYYLEKADLTDENPYIQCVDWQKHPWDAPADAVDWNAEKEKYDLIMPLH